MADYLTPTPLPALGMASLVLGVIALLLAFLPILGIPLSVCGMVLGLAGIIASFKAPGSYLRWSVAGLAASCLAFGVNVAIDNGPGQEVPGPEVPRPWQGVPDRPSAPPPARPLWDGSRP